MEMTRSWVAIAAAGLLAACGGAPAASEAAKTSVPAPAGEAGRPADDLIRHLEAKAKRRGGPAPGAAVVTFAVFSPAEAPKNAQERAVALRGIIELAYRDPPPALAAVIEKARPRPELAISIAPVDEALPLNLEAVAASAGPLAEAVRGARSAVFVHYAGPPEDGARHLRAAAVAAALVAEAPATVVFDLGTLRAWSPSDWRAWINAPDWLADQVTIEASRADDGTLMFYTRGMAKLGLPDLEQGGVPMDRARELFDAFQRAYGALRAHGYAKPGDRVGDLLLRPCQRPPTHYDHECVALDPP